MSANFGFCFKSSAPSSSSCSSSSPVAAVYVSHEPNAKKRRTQLQTILTSAPDGSESVAAPCQSEVVRKSPPARGKKPFDQGEGATHGSNAFTASADDSFIARVRTKRKPVEASQNVGPDAMVEKCDVGVGEAAIMPQGRPGKRAVVHALGEVANHPTERSICVEGKRRGGFQGNHTISGDKIDARSRKQSHGAPPVLEGAHKKRRTKAAVTERRTAADEGQAARQEPHAGAPAATAKRKGRAAKRETTRPCINATEMPNRDEAGSKRESPQRVAEIEIHAVRRKSLAVKADGTEANRINHAVVSGRSRVLPTPTEAIADSPRRVPLRESDRNALSISPDKKTTARTAGFDEHAKPRKANSAFSRTWRDDSPPSRAGNMQKPPNGTVPAPIEQHPPEEDEDVAWLLEPAPSKTLAQPHPSRKKAAQSTRRTRPKMADIDLDDLLSDIAAFAKVDACVGVGERVDAGRGMGQKSKRR